MKKNILISVMILSFLFQGAIFGEKRYLSRKFNFTENSVNGIKYLPGNWKHPDYSKPFESFGNHRFVIRTDKYGKYVHLLIPWRRADEHPEKKEIVIAGSNTGRIVNNLITLRSGNKIGEFIFEPFLNESKYFLYYLPHRSSGGYYPRVEYIGYVDNSDRKWKAGYNRLSSREKKALPFATVISAQSIDSFHSFFPMEIIAGGDEVKEFIKRYPRRFYLFPEFRENPIRMRKFLPFRWITGGLKNGIRDSVGRGEFYTFQLGVYSPDTDLSDIKVKFSGLESERGEKIEKNGLECINTSGVDINGRFFTKKLNVKKGRVQALWMGLNIPVMTNPGKYMGKITVTPKGLPPETMEIELNVSDSVVKDHGDNDPKKMSRLRWLNSRIGEDRNFIIKPFAPVSVCGKRIKITGREIGLNNLGLPRRIQSSFSKSVTSFKEKPEDILSGSVNFFVIMGNGKYEKWSSKPFKVKQSFKSEARWRALNSSGNFYLKVDGRIEYDGMIDYKIRLTAKKSCEISDIKLIIPLRRDAAKYMLGLGRKGGKRPENFSWKWDVKYCQEGVWLGNVNKGIQYVLRDENYERPLNTNFYHSKPLKLPRSWGNGGKGGINIRTIEDGGVEAENFSGPRKMKTGETLFFNVRFLITPFKLIDLKKHFKTRFVHKYLPVDKVLELGGTVVNVHHATEINPYINYPFFNLKRQKAYIDEAHGKGIKVKLYYTIRELTYRAYELFALRSLGDEIFNDGEGGGHSWLQEHLRSHYHSAWHATNVNDAAILDKGTSRWTNYYIEGLNWLAKNQKIDGLYLDDIAFSRETVKRIATVLNKQRKDVIIDLHSANQFNERDGFVNSAFLYMEHFPYVSRLWFGEYFDYDMGPDYWLTEVSGIPFGLTGEMLEKGGHPYRGLVYGMTTRVYGKYNPGEIWKLFDSFNIMESEMFGYWADGSPVVTSVKNIRSTVYRGEGKLLIVIGSWSHRDEKVPLKVNWEDLGFGEDESLLYAPEIKGLQENQVFRVGDPVPVNRMKGLILILKKR